MPSRLISIALVLASVYLMSGLAGQETPAQAARDSNAEAFGSSGDEEVAIFPGSVIAEGRPSEDGMCVFEEAFGVRVWVDGEGPPLIVKWRIDDRCRVVVTGVAESESVSDDPPDDGHLETPSEAP